MSSKTIKGEIYDLDILKEYKADFKELTESNLSQIVSDIYFQKWDKYFDMLSGPIYPDLVKDF